MAPLWPIAAWSVTIFNAGSLTIVWRGIGRGSGASLFSQASVQGDLNCRECFPVLLLDLTVWLDEAASIFSLIFTEVSDSVVGKKTDAHQTPPSVPDTTKRSTPASTCLIACCFAPTNAATGTPWFFPISNIHLGGTPNALATSLIGWEKATSKTSWAISNPLPRRAFEFFSICSDLLSDLRLSPSNSYSFKISDRKSRYSWGIIDLKSSNEVFSPLPL